MKKLLEGKSAIITGASKGLGREISLSFAREGAFVGLFSRDERALISLKEEIEKAGGKSMILKGDATVYEDVKNAVQKFIEEAGKIDILVNNAGIGEVIPVLEMKEEDWDRTINANLKSVFFFSKEAGKHMVKARSGRIINIASINGIKGEGNLTAYCASKAGVIGFTKALALEWAPYNVLVNAVAPGYFVSEMTRKALEDEKMRERLIRRIPLRRFASPEEIAGIVLYLASDMSSFVTGSVFVIDGGETAR
jgi:NAD(P)-dependent dehydrogenase (short-subunit alcohol dehydrogenase family)